MTTETAVFLGSFLQAVIEFKPDGTILTANRNFLNAMGYSLEEIKGQHHSLFVEPTYRTTVEYRMFWEKLGRGEYDAGQYKRIGKGGKEIWRKDLKGDFKGQVGGWGYSESPLVDGDTVTVGELTLDVYHCPGHTPGHVVFHHAPSKLAIVGDVIFQGSIGRTDFPMGNHQDLLDAITGKLWPLGGDTVFVPGHGQPSNFAQERRTNPFVADAVLARS